MEMSPERLLVKVLSKEQQSFITDSLEAKKGASLKYYFQFIPWLVVRWAISQSVFRAAMTSQVSEIGFPSPLLH